MLGFLDIPDSFRDLGAARYAILPVPYEATVCYQRGTAAAPAAILEASEQLECHDMELGGEFFGAGIAVCPPVESAGRTDEQVERVRAAVEGLLTAGKFPLLLGGEHSITVGAVQGAVSACGPLSVLQIDAHADLRQSYQGSTLSHACVMRRVLETTTSICQVGIRSVSAEEIDQCPRQAAAFITPEVIRSHADWVDRVLGMLGERVYLTVDFDGLDPAIAPGVGTPEPDGLTWREITGLLRRVSAERQVVAADIVEVLPIAGSALTEYLAAKLAYKIIAYTQQ